MRIYVYPDGGWCEPEDHDESYDDFMVLDINGDEDINNIDKLAYKAANNLKGEQVKKT